MDQYSDKVSATLTAIKLCRSRGRLNRLVKNLLNLTLNHFDRVARFKLADRSYLEDVLSVMYRKAVMYIDSYDGVSNGYGWLYSILIKTIYTVNRSVKNYRTNEVPIDEVPEPSVRNTGELRAGIMLALESADIVDRDIIIMYYYDQMSLREIGEKLNMSNSSVSYRKERAELLVKDFFENFYSRALDI